MKIGIIGAGMIGGTLARRFAALGHDVSFANSRGPDTISGLAAEIGARAVTATEAARSGDFVILAIPEKAVVDLPKDLFAGVPASVVVIDANNYDPARDGRIAAIEAGQSDSQWVSEQIGRPVVKAFNHISFMSLRDKGLPKGAAGRLALAVTGNPPEARAKVVRLLDELGFDAVEGGGLEESWRHQPGAPAYLGDIEAAPLKDKLAAADKSQVPAYREAANDAVKAYFQTPQA